MAKIDNMETYCRRFLDVCNKEIEKLTHPERNGGCLDRYNRIVIDKPRLMTVTIKNDNMVTYELHPFYPTLFTAEAAREIVERNIFKDCNDKIIQMEIIRELEYYQIIKEKIEELFEVFNIKI